LIRETLDLKTISLASDNPMTSTARRKIPRNMPMRPRTSFVFPKKATLPKIMESVENNKIILERN
jgi:hypothetical protein